MQSGSMTIADDGQTPCLPRLAQPGGGEDFSLQVCRQAHRLAVLTIGFAQHADGQKSRSTILHNDVVHMSRATVQMGLLVDYIADRYT
jgi:hypothetical protein